MRIYQYVMIAKMVLADKPTNKESESVSAELISALFDSVELISAESVTADWLNSVGDYVACITTHVLS